MGYGILGIKGKTPSLIAMGVLKLNAMEDHYMRLHHIFERVTSLIAQYLPDEMAIEAPFFGKNVQSMLKLGHRAWQWLPPSTAKSLSRNTNHEK